MVFYEAPHRILECVADMTTVFGGEREILIAREMTKLHEQIVRMPLADTADWFAADANRVRGEFVLVLAGAPAGEGLDAEALRVLDLLLAELPVRSAASLAAEITGAPRKAFYAQALLRRREEWSVRDGGTPGAAGSGRPRAGAPIIPGSNEDPLHVNRLPLSVRTTGTFTCATMPRSRRWCRTPPRVSVAR